MTNSQQDVLCDLIATHQALLERIENRAQRSYTFLALGCLVSSPFVVFGLGVELVSLPGVGLLLLAFMVTVVLGRTFWLADVEERLRYVVEDYCQDKQVPLDGLIEAAVQAGRYEFFVKLFRVVPGEKGSASEN